MTPHEQIALVLFVMLFGALTLLYLVDLLAEKIEAYQAREKVWRAIEVRCSRERHPSFQASLYDWEKEETVVATGTNPNEWRHYFN